MALRIIIDEDLSPSIGHALCDTGIEATSIRDHGMLGWKDWEILPRPAQEQLTLCTANGDEWEGRALRWRTRGESHHGILIVSQDWGTEGILRALQSYVTTDAPDALVNRVVRIPSP